MRETPLLPQRTPIAKTSSLAQVMGILFNVMFLDHLATDVEHLERLNQVLNDSHITRDKNHEAGRVSGSFVC